MSEAAGLSTPPQRSYCPIDEEEKGTMHFVFFLFVFLAQKEQKLSAGTTVKASVSVCQVHLQDTTGQFG